MLPPPAKKLQNFFGVFLQFQIGVDRDEPKRITGLHTDEVYTLLEQTAPDGYTVAESIRFKLVQRVDENNDLLDAADVYVCTGKDWLIFDHWELVEDSTVVMLDAPVPKVWVSKRDLTNGEELSGATLQVIDKDGTVVEEWISGEEPHQITGLYTDEAYTLVEQVAPDGYIVAESIRFKLVQRVDKDGNSLNENDVYICAGKDWLIFDYWELVEDSTVVMLDARKPDEPGPTPTPEPKQPDEPAPTPSPEPLPQTGDLPWLPVMLAITGALCASAYALWALISKRKKNQPDVDGSSEEF